MAMRLAIIDGDGALYRAAWNVENSEEAIEKYLDIVQGYAAEMWCDKSTIFVGGKGNWRYDIFDGYKFSRKGEMTDKQIQEKQWRDDIVKFLVDNKLAIASDGCEADDLVRRKAHKCRDRGIDYVVISADKDLDMVMGEHMRPNNQTGDYTHYSITDEESDYNYFKQILIGDMSDSIKSPAKLGPKTAEKLLASTSHKNWRKMVEKEYQERCGSEWLHALYFTGSLVHIQRHQGDMFNWNKKGTWFDLGFEGPPSCYDYSSLKGYKEVVDGKDNGSSSVSTSGSTEAA